MSVFEYINGTNLGATHACFSGRGRRRTYSTTGSDSYIGNGGFNLGSCSVIYDEILRENATLNIIGDITSVARASIVVDLRMSDVYLWGQEGQTHVSWSEGTGKKSLIRIGSNSCELLSESKNDVLVNGSSTGGSRILMLLDSCNLRVDRSLAAENTGQSNFSSVSLQSGVQQSIGLASNIASCLCVGESLIGCSLMETVQVGNLSSTGSSGCVTEKTEDGVLDIIRVVEGQVDSDAIEESVVGVFLGNLATHHHPWDGDGDDILGSGSGGCSCESEEDSNDGYRFVLHDDDDV